MLNMTMVHDSFVGFAERFQVVRIVCVFERKARRVMKNFCRTNTTRKGARAVGSGQNMFFYFCWDVPRFSLNGVRFLLFQLCRAQLQKFFHELVPLALTFELLKLLGDLGVELHHHGFLGRPTLCRTPLTSQIQNGFQMRISSDISRTGTGNIFRNIVQNVRA